MSPNSGRKNGGGCLVKLWKPDQNGDVSAPLFHGFEKQLPGYGDLEHEFYFPYIGTNTPN